ncbi:MAG: FAD-binding oxidoreductase [Clostridium chrysemydis]|uniref:FAD-binding oxidoreductase n=1 Tax=Clostridium TaxID=1485 RepID=UPI0021527D85|nr:FAD-binding oxidoreductase [Clostridium sp. LY3-2]MCR6513530.1 FAD-binding oxidoreductase [Clostridium sp. LY3-2]
MLNKVKENDFVTSFYLKRNDNKKLKEHKAGQFVSIDAIKDGANKGAIRQYSLSMKPGSDNYRISVKREDKGIVSSYLHDNINKGDIVKLTNPLGEFLLKENSNRPVVFLSGGIGVTPVLSMLYKAAEEGRDILFVQAVLNSKAHTFKEELRILKEKHKNIKSAVFYQSPLESDKILEDYDHLGIVSKEWLLNNMPKNGEFYFCGPLGFMKHINDTLKEIGISKEDRNYEMFGPSKDLDEI